MTKPAGGSVKRTARTPPLVFDYQFSGRGCCGSRAMPEDQFQPVAFTSEHGGDRRICSQRLFAIGAECNQHFLIDENSRPCDNREHPVAHHVGKAKIDSIS